MENFLLIETLNSPEITTEKIHIMDVFNVSINFDDEAGTTGSLIARRNIASSTADETSLEMHKIETITEDTQGVMGEDSLGAWYDFKTSEDFSGAVQIALNKK